MNMPATVLCWGSTTSNEHWVPCRGVTVWGLLVHSYSSSPQWASYRQPSSSFHPQHLDRRSSYTAFRATESHQTHVVWEHQRLDVLTLTRLHTPPVHHITCWNWSVQQSRCNVWMYNVFYTRLWLPCSLFSWNSVADKHISLNRPLALTDYSSETHLTWRAETFMVQIYVICAVSSPDLQLSTKSSSRTTTMQRGMLPTDSRWT